MAKLNKTPTEGKALPALQSALAKAKKLNDQRPKLVDEQVIGEAIARAVETAELRNPGAGLGDVKRGQVIAEIVNSLPIKGPCAPFLKALARLLVGVLVEIAVAAFQRKWKTV